MVAAVKYPHVGDRGLAIIRGAIADGFYACTKSSEVAAALNASAKYYLTRDTKDGNRFYATEQARAMIWAREAESVKAEKAVSTVERDMFGLVSTVMRAKTALDNGDVMAAKQLATGAYIDAKGQAQYAASFGAAGKRVLAKARQLQGDALLIETRAKMSIAAAYKAAQAEGRAARQGRPKNIENDNVFTLAEAGLSATEIHLANKLLDAEEREPGFAERAIAARIAADLEPSRRSLKAAIGTKTATQEERGHNLYETPAEAMHTLLALETFSATIWEPACGRGAISRRLEDAGYDVELSDLVDYGTADRNGTVQEVADFLESQHSLGGEFFPCPDIVTNPPYGEALNAFVAHALRVHRPRKMALLLNLNFFCGFADDDRNFVMDDMPPARVHIFRRRLPMMHRDGWDGPKASSSMNTAWFVWERDEAGNYGDQTVTRRVDWADFQPAAAESEAA